MNKAPYSIRIRFIITVIAAIVFFFAYIFISMQYLYGSDGHITKIDSDGTQILEENLDSINALPNDGTFLKAKYRGGLHVGQGDLAGSFIDVYVTVPESLSIVEEYIGRYFPLKEDEFEHNQPSYAKILKENRDSVDIILHILLSDEHDAVHAWASENIDYTTQDVANNMVAIAPFMILLLIWFPYERVRKGK